MDPDTGESNGKDLETVPPLRFDPQLALLFPLEWKFSRLMLADIVMKLPVIWYISKPRDGFSELVSLILPSTTRRAGRHDEPRANKTMFLTGETPGTSAHADCGCLGFGSEQRRFAKHRDRTLSSVGRVRGWI